MQLSKIKWWPLIISIAISLGVGGLSSLFSQDSMQQYRNYERPPLSPPGIVFPIVWTILFILMGISAYIIYTSNADKSQKLNALFLFGLQLIINFFWPIIFFNLEMRLFAFLWIMLLWVVLIVMIVNFYKIDKCAAYLQIPYLLWVTFAAYLNLAIYIINR